MNFNAPEEPKQKCPKCGKPMVIRKRRSDGNKFLGCTGFPTCRTAMNYTPGEVTPTNVVVKKIETPSQYQTNIFGHLFVEGNFFLKQEDEDYFFQLEYRGNTTVFQYTYEDDSYDVLKIKNDKDIVTVFYRDKTV